MIWLEADELLENEGKREIAKAEAAVRCENLKVVFEVLCDLRHIQISKLSFRDKAQYQSFIDTLPSSNTGAKKEKIQRSWKVRKRKHGEIPEWKRKKQEECNTQSDAETG